MRQRRCRRREGVDDEPGAVEAVGAGRGPHVRLAELRHRHADRAREARRRGDDRVGQRSLGGDAHHRVGRLLLLRAVRGVGARLCCLRHLQLPSLLGRHQRGDLPLDRGEQRLLLGQLRRDRLLRRRALRDDALLVLTRARQLRAIALDGGAEGLDLAEHVRVEIRHAAGVVEAVDHVVEALRAENHLEGRRRLGSVERDEPGRDRALALLQVVPCDAELTLVLTEVALDPLQLRRRGVVLGAGPLERVGQVAKLTHHLLRLCALRGDRGVAERWDRGHEGNADPRENVRRLPQPAYDKPQGRGRDWRTGRGRYVTSAGG